MSWHQAVEFTTRHFANKGHLVSIESIEEHNFLIDTFRMQSFFTSGMFKAGSVPSYLCLPSFPSSLLRHPHFYLHLLILFNLGTWYWRVDSKYEHKCTKFCRFPIPKTR